MRFNFNASFFSFLDKIELTIPGSLSLSLSALAGTYILAPEIVNKDTYWDGAYWISANGKYAIWYCISCTSVDFIIGRTSDLGGEDGYLFGWDGCAAWYAGGICKLLAVTDWQYNGKRNTEGISITTSINCNYSKLLVEKTYLCCNSYLNQNLINALGSVSIFCSPCCTLG